MRVSRSVAVVLGLGILASACSSSAVTSETSDAVGLSIDNEGGALEGHTPRGFAGMGTGLFVGDNLNPGFPDGDGVQIFLSFALPEEMTQPSSASLRSDAMHISGSPFEDLGSLQVTAVTYESFGPHLFDLASDLPSTPCIRVDDHSVGCDVTAEVASAIAAGSGWVQFRLALERPGDGDGEQDLALFYRSDSNTNEPGVFVLEITP